MKVVDPNNANAHHDDASTSESETVPTTAGLMKYHYRDYAKVQESDDESAFEAAAQAQLPPPPAVIQQHNHHQVMAHAMPRYARHPGGDPHSMRLQKFPAKLDSILSRPEWQDVITWMPHGRSWKIMKPHDFETLVMPLYFDHCNYHSFNRLVNAWSFRRMSSGPDRGSYYHDLFLRGRPNLHKHMRRLPKSTKKQPMCKEDEPDFYSMEKLEALPETEPSMTRSGPTGPFVPISKGPSPGYGAGAPSSSLAALAAADPYGSLGVVAGLPGGGNGSDDVANALLDIRVQQQLERQYSSLSAFGGANPYLLAGAPGPAAASAPLPASFLSPAVAAGLPYGSAAAAAGLGASAGLGMGGLSTDSYYAQILLAKRDRDENLLSLQMQLQQQQQQIQGYDAGQVAPAPADMARAG